jgi:hypothetical protein
MDNIARASTTGACMVIGLMFVVLNVWLKCNGDIGGATTSGGVYSAVGAT